MLESVSRTAADKPHVFHLRMPVDQKIAVGSIFVLAHARLDHRRISQSRETACPHISARFPPPQPSASAIACRDRRALRDDRAQFSARGPRCPAFRNTHPPEKATSAKPAAQIARLPAARQKRKLPAGLGKFSVRESREKLCRATTRKQKQTAPPKSFRRCCTSRSQTPSSPRLLNQSNPKLHALLDGILDHRRNRSPRQKHAALRLQKSARHAFERNLRITPLQRRVIHLFKRHFAALQCRHRLAHARIIFARQPQHSRLVKKPLPGRRTKTLPLRQRPLRRPRINLIRSITHSNDARLPARTSPRVRRSIRIQQHHALPAPRQMPRAPSPKHSRPNNRRVVSFSQ